MTNVDIPNKTVDAGQVGVKSGGPSIGLVLGSGAARGFAHIGVMRALQAHGIKPDIIVGTSMGALVGGCYGTDQLDTLEDWARSLTMRRIIGYLDVRIGGSGLIGGGRLANRLQDSIGKALIEDLPIRFAAIATEIGTGHEVWLTRGSLSLAVRASYALPGIFPPVYLGGRWLVDGALVNPVPVSAARALGARVVIAVNMDADRFGRGTTIASHGSALDDAPPVAAVEHARNGFARLRGIFSAERALKRQIISGDSRPTFSTVMVESFNIMQDRLTRMRLAGDPPDVHITPRIGHIGWLDFHRLLRRRISRASGLTGNLLGRAAELTRRIHVGIASARGSADRLRTGNNARRLAVGRLGIAQHHAVRDVRSLRKADSCGGLHGGIADCDGQCSGAQDHAGNAARLHDALPYVGIIIAVRRYAGNAPPRAGDTTLRHCLAKL